MQPSGKLRYTLISIWRIRILGFPYNGSIPLQTYWVMTLLVTLRQWIHHQGVHNILDLLSWEEDELKTIPVHQVFTLDDHGQGSYLRTNQTKQICGLITYMKHAYREYMSGIEVRTNPFHPFSPEEWNQHTSTMLRTFLVENLPNPIGPQPVISGPIPSSRPTGYSPAAIELMGFKKGIKRDSCLPFPIG